MTKTKSKTEKKAAKTVRVWFIRNQDFFGYWTDKPQDFLNEFSEMSPDDKYKITCKDLTEKEFAELEKSSHEFEGW